MAANVVSVRNDLSDTWLSLRFELLKHLRRRRVYIVAAMAVIVPLFFYIYYYQERPEAAVDFAGIALMFVDILVVVSAAMFAGDAVCGEFESKTSLLVFPTPQKRSSIFAGKYLAALMATFLVVSLYYVVLSLQTGQLFGWGDIPQEIGESFLMALVYSASAVSLAFLISGLLKRSMSATIVSFLVLMMILPIIQMIVSAMDREPWFIVTYSGDLITSVLGASSSLPTGPGGGTHDRGVLQFTPQLGTGLAVMAAWAAGCLASGMALAVRKED